MSGRTAKQSGVLLAKRTRRGPPAPTGDRSDLAFLWLSTLTLASFGSIFALSWALAARDGRTIRPPSFVATAAGSASPGGAEETLALAARSEAARRIVPPSEPATAVMPASPPATDRILASMPGTAGSTDAAGPAASVRPAFVRAKLALLSQDARSDGAAASHPATAAASMPDSVEAMGPMTVAMSPLYRPDIETLVSLTALDFPFAKAGASLGGAQTIDPVRFGAPDAWQGYAPEPERPRARPFAGFALGTVGVSWRRLSDGTADDALAMGARAHGESRFGEPSAGSARSFLSRTVGAALPALNAAEGSDASETEEAFFAPDDATRQATIADAIERAARARGLTGAMTTQVLNLLAAEYDFGRPVTPDDRLDVFFSEGDEADLATATSEVYFIRASFGGTYRAFYRLAGDDGSVAYFGPEGRSAEQVLLRHPVPSGRLQSGFGMRRHPILGYERMHEGIDWSAPQGTPIFATASGTVEQAGPKGGYGLQTVIRHEDGYTTSYAHQSALAEAVAEGAFVRQGDVIGLVGSSGLATGAHIHYEVMRDGVAIDPMDAPTSKGPMLRGDRLDAFLAERDRIDALVYSSDDAVLTLAAVRD